jgi:O-antigen/teichoic acid export membrane protein
MSTEVKADYQSIRSGSLGQRMRFLFRDTAIYGGASAVGKLFSIFTLPILTRVFTRSEYGVVDAINVFGAVFLVIITLGQDSAIARFYYETDDPQERKQIVAQALLVEALLCLAVCSVLIYISDWLVAGPLGLPGHASLFRIMVATFPFVTLVNFFRNLLKWTFARAGFILLSLGVTVLIVLLTITLVVGLHRGIYGPFLANLLGMAAFSVVGFILCRKHLAWPRGFSFGRPMLRFGWPYMAAGVMGTLLPAVDRRYVTQFFGLESNGLYAVAYRMATLIMLPITAFQTAWGPFSFALYREKDAQATYDRVLVLFCSAASLAAAVLVLAADPTVRILASSRYALSAGLVLPLTFGLVAKGASWITGIGIDLSKKTQFGLIADVSGVLILLGVIPILIRPLGLTGIACGVMTAQVIQGLIYTALAYRLYPLRFRWRMPCAILASTATACALVQYAVPGGPLVHVPVRTGVLALLAFGIWKWVLSPSERSRVSALFRKTAPKGRPGVPGPDAE